MRFRCGIVIFGLFSLVSLVEPAMANADGLTYWDRNIADEVDRAVMVNPACEPTNPYLLYRQTCVGNQLNITLERSPFDRLSDLDHLALFVHRHRNLNTSQQLLPGIKFKLNLNLSNIYQQEAKLEARLGVRW